MFCVSKTRGVSSPFICYRFGKISKYIFTTGYANVTVYKKRACSPPNMADPAKRKFYRKTARHHSAADFHAPALHRPGSYPAAGGRGTQSVPPKKSDLPILRTENFLKRICYCGNGLFYALGSFKLKKSIALLRQIFFHASVGSLPESCR